MVKVIYWFFRGANAVCDFLCGAKHKTVSWRDKAAADLDATIDSFDRGTNINRSPVSWWRVTK